MQSLDAAIEEYKINKQKAVAEAANVPTKNTKKSKAKQQHKNDGDKDAASPAEGVEGAEGDKKKKDVVVGGPSDENKHVNRKEAKKEKKEKKPKAQPAKPVGKLSVFRSPPTVH